MEVPRSFTEIRNLISSGDIDMKGLVSFYLGNIREKQHLNAFIEVFGEEALEKAGQVQQKIERGNEGRLAGIPAISLPLGRHPEGMPFGLQIMSAGLNESGLLSFSDFMMKRFRSLA